MRSWINDYQEFECSYPTNEEIIEQYDRFIANANAIKDCPYDEPLHYHHDGCPACETA